MNWKVIGIIDKFRQKRADSVGIALSGGGAKGFAHIGVMMGFEKFGIKPDVISGVSSGSIAAVLYSAGLTPNEMMECFAQTKFGDFTEWSIPKEGLLKIDKFGKHLESWLPVKRLEELKIPTVVCATNFDKGTSVGWAKGEIVPRVLASCSIPIIFHPMKINGVNYVDGGVLRNLPAWAIRDYCTTLYGSNCSPLDPTYQYKNSILDIALRSYRLMSKANTLQDIQLCDHLIQLTELSTVRTFDLSSLKESVLAGYELTCVLLEKLFSKQ